MIPYSRGLMLDNSNNYGIVKTETVFGFSPTNNDMVNHSFNSTEPMEWIITRGNFERRSLDTMDGSQNRNLNPQTITPIPKKSKNQSRSKKKQTTKRRKGKGKLNKCIFKVIKKGERKKRKRNTQNKMSKKFMMPMLLGLFAAKSLLIPVALKALAFISAKGLMMGFFSTIMASVLSLKGMFDHHHHYQNRKDEGKTQVEIIQVPSKSEDHVYYDDVHYRRGDYGYTDNYVLPPYRTDGKEVNHPYVDGKGVNHPYMDGKGVNHLYIDGKGVNHPYMDSKGENPSYIDRKGVNPSYIDDKRVNSVAFNEDVGIELQR